jgi:type I restriction enzyme S subunit
MLNDIPFALPSIEEQTEIVRRVESLFALADTVEKQYLAAKQRLDRLSQSLLAKAFRGELVPQDSNDEPAAELLKRIQAERQAQPAANRKRSKPA